MPFYEKQRKNDRYGASGHEDGDSRRAAPSQRPRSSRTIPFKDTLRKTSPAAGHGIGSGPGSRGRGRGDSTKESSNFGKTSRSRKREASSPHGHSAFLERLVATENASRKDATSPSQLDMGGLSLRDDGRGDASALFVRRKSPRQEVAEATLQRLIGRRPKTASPSRSPSRSPKRGERRRSKSPASAYSLRSLSTPQPPPDGYSKDLRAGKDGRDVNKESLPWAFTELPESEGFATSDLDDEDVSTPDVLMEESGSKEDEKGDEEKMPEAQTERILKDPIREMMSGPSEDNDEYDTDLEEEFPPKPRIPRDIAGKQVYVQKCKEEGVDPASYVLRHLSDHAFRLRHRYLNFQNVVPLTKAMKCNSVIEALDLRDNHLEDESGVAIANMLENNINITKVDVSHNLVRGRGIAAFSSMLESNYTLKTLCLRANHLTDKDAVPLAEALRNNATLTELDLSHNELGELAGVHLGSGLAVNDGLNYLDLRWNAVRSKGIVSIANALKVNTSLEVLDLSNNGVSIPGCIALMRALRVNAGLRILDLSCNHINSVGMQKLSLALKKNARLEALLLKSNPAGDEGMVALCKALKVNQTLKLVSVQNIPLPLIIHQKLRDVQEARDIHILKLDVDGHKRNTAPSHVAAMVDQFICDNQSRILNHCFAQDVDQSGTLAVGQVTKALWDAGLDVDKEQLDTALRQTKVSQLRSVPYRPMLDGLSALMMIGRKAPSLRVL